MVFPLGGVGGGPKKVRPPRPPPSCGEKQRGGLSCESYWLASLLFLAFISGVFGKFGYSPNFIFSYSNFQILKIAICGVLCVIIKSALLSR